MGISTRSSRRNPPALQANDKTIAELAGTQPLSEVYEDLYKHVSLRRKHFLMEYKNDEYKVKGDGTWAKNEKVRN